MSSKQLQDSVAQNAMLLSKSFESFAEPRQTRRLTTLASASMARLNPWFDSGKSWNYRSGQGLAEDVATGPADVTNLGLVAVVDSEPTAELDIWHQS
jgi:hypothetical protein